MEQLLATKLFIPTARPDLVSRPHLIEQLNVGLHRKLTLISAPAGFGKTTLVSEWVAGCGRSAAWLSLDKDDNDPNRFLAYLVAALQTVVPNIGQGVMGALQFPQPLSEAVLTALLNEITALPQDLIFVLDDYYLVEAKVIDEALAFLVENLPPQFHIVIATRENPSLPLARYRARGQMTELRAADLRFSPAEAAEFLNPVMGLDLSAEEIAALEKSTEGWIAGLQMAALSMQGRADTASFIQAFTGSHHFVLDYLVEEVLQRQPENVRSFLLDTAILERLCGPLCDAVTGGTGGKEILAALERGNLFVVPLDEVRQWYRYHHLFADVLLAYLQDERPERLANLHQRASQWYEQNDLPSYAIRHALATKDFERTANLLELAFPAMERSVQTTTWLKWVQALPEELIHTRPVLIVNYAGALLDSGMLEGVEAWLESAEHLLARTGEPGWDPAQEMVVVDEKQFRSLPARIALARAHIAQIQGDYASAVNYAELVLDRLPEDDHHIRGTMPGVLALAHWASGNLEAAKQAFIDFGRNMQSDETPFFIIVSSGYLSEIVVEQGRLQEALRIYQEALRLAAEQGSHSQRVTAHLHLGLALLYLEMGNTAAATQNLDRSRQLSEQMSLTDWPHRWHLAQSRFKAAEGDLEAALEMLDEAERLYVPNPVPDFRPIMAQRARVYLKQGRLAMAQVWVQERGLSVDDQLNYLQEFEHITLARLRIAEIQGQRSEQSIRETMEFLARLLDAAENGKRLGSMIEILALQALAYQEQGDLPLALERLGRALALAEPEGYLRIFVDEGPPMESLLREAKKRDMAQNYINQLQSAFRGVKRTSSGQPLVEPLSERELEVLRLLRTELSGPEIASHLMISLSTMRTHTRNIYSKLGVNNRRSAVRRAKEIELL